MKKNILFCCCCLAVLQNAPAQGFLKADGKIIVDARGNKVILRGMGLGGWMLQEGYMFKLGGLGQQYRIREKIGELVGVQKAAQFYDGWLRNHTTQADVDSMAAWGFNSVRLPMHFNLYALPVGEEPIAGQNTWLEKGFEMTDSLLAWCAKRHMYLILDLHATPGGQGNDLPIADRDPAQPALWQSEANRQKTIALWRKLAARYAYSEWIGGYDIINEPNWGFDDPKDTRGTAEQNNRPLRQLMVDITKAIREVDSKHIVIIEGNGFGNNYNGIVPDWDNNLVMSFHKYGNFNTTASISRFLALRQQFNIPLWMGESGENFNTWFTEAIGLAEQNDIGWAWWQEKKMNLNNPLEIKQPKNYQLFLDYCTGKSIAKPSPERSWTVLAELLDNLKIQNNIYHKDVIDAMFRQVRSPLSIPFVAISVGKVRATIHAVDYDLGRQRSAYYDKDSARYQYTAGVNTTGNRGGMYRNDGVDIQKDSAGYYVFSIEDGEWLQYTVNVHKTGKYQLSFSVASEKAQAVMIASDNVTGHAVAFPVPSTGGMQQWQQVAMPGAIYLAKGTHALRVYFEKGGCNFRDIIIQLQK